MSQMILEYDEFCMFLLNIEVFNINTANIIDNYYHIFIQYS
jgi:hypothetical protein